MKVETISENSSIELTDNQRDKAKIILENNPSLPMRIHGNMLSFSEYTIGELRISDLTIYIKPRNESFSLEDFFQILQFIDRPLLEDVEGYGFESSGSLFKVSDISRELCHVCSQLLQFGLTGNYIDEFTYETELSGDIVFSEYRAQMLPVTGIPANTTNYDINIKANQIIRAALVRLIEIENNNENAEKFQILRDFEYITDVSFSINEVDVIINEFYTSNPFYISALELSRRVLFKLELEYKDGDIDWLAFLENSNSIFESYVLRVLDLYLDESVIKWPSPKAFAQLKSSTGRGEKSYSPDILINYNKNDMSASVVIDVKNKSFRPSQSKSLSNVVSSADIYQMLFYCRQLKTNYGGLIYPSLTTNEPIRITFDSSDNLQLYLFSLNMNVHIKKRHIQLAKDIREYLLVKT